jgi:hypothetical protein
VLGFILWIIATTLFLHFDSRGKAASGKHKLRVRNTALANDLRGQGGRLIADYGAYQMIEVEDEIVARFASRGGDIEVRDEENQVQLNAGAIDTTAGAVQAGRSAAETGAAGEKRLHLVQFAGPVKPEWQAALRNTGVEIINYIPHNAYLVYGETERINRMKTWAANAAEVQWEGAYQSDYKVAPSAVNKNAGAAAETLYAVQLVEDASINTGNAGTFALIEQLKTSPIKQQFRVGRFLNLVVGLPQSSLSLLAERNDLISIARHTAPRRFDERQDLILAGNVSGGLPSPGDYLSFLASQGFTQAQFTASNFAINISDTGLDNATTSPTHFGLYVAGNKSNASRVIYNRLVGTPSGAGSTLQGCDGHGNLNAHIAAGYIPGGAPFNAFPHADAAGFRYGLGVAPFVRVGSSVIFDGSSNPEGDYTYPNLADLESRAWQDGARISSNSWGTLGSSQYTIDSQAFDYLVRDSQPAGATFEAAGNQQNVIIFAAGNAGPVAQSLSAPGTAKNVITVGASESVQAFGGPDRCLTGDANADNADDVSAYSSQGPTADGRKKPDVVAPGTHVTGGVFQVANPPANGEANPCFTASAICGGPASTPNFWPLGQRFYTASSGTSHSTPAVAGAAALLRQRFLNAGLAAPSPAMTKAILMNTARYLTGAGANDTLWSTTQGMGAVNLQSAFGVFATPALIRDQVAADLLTASGQVRIFTGTISDATKPFRVTLAWTDAPGSTAGNAWVNNLDLEIILNGQSYKGNVFSGAASATGGSFDDRNNVESVFIPAGVTGTFTVRVTATNIAGDGVPGNGNALDQDFALVVNNMNEGLTPIIDPGAAALTAESCSPANAAVDPGETVTMSFTLQNNGRSATGNLVATLLATGGVESPGAAQSYGALAALGGSASRSFSFRAGGVCGGSITATFQLQDGASNLGTASFTIPLGTMATVTQTISNASFPITIPSSGAANPYPSTINVTGINGTITKATVTLYNVNHPNPDDIDVLLVGPGGERVLLWSDAGGGNALNNVTLTFDDAAALVPDSAQITAGTYSPTNYGIGDLFPVPAPGGSYPNPPRLASLNGLNPNGVWSLYVVDDLANNGGNIATGWALNISTIAPSCCNSPACSLNINPVSIATGATGVPYSQAFTQTGGTGTINYSLSGALPNGLSFSNGTLAGTPTQSGSYPITITASSSNGCTGMRTYTLVVTAGCGNTIIIGPDSLVAGTIYSAYSRTLTATGGSFPYIFSVSAGLLPAGLGLQPDGTLAGTPLQIGTFNFTVRVTDQGGCVVTRNFALTVNLPVGVSRAKTGDFDADGKSDVGIWRGSTGNWIVIRSASEAVTAYGWGAAAAPYNDVAVPGDYDGDGRIDYAVWRQSTGFWYILQSSDGAIRGEALGQNGDVPVPGDYDSDGRTDLATWRKSDGVWRVKKSTDGQLLTQAWGSGIAPYNDRPVPADYDGDGKTDFAVWRENGFWYVLKSSDGLVQSIAWGAPLAPHNDLAAPADYDGDGKADIAVWRRQDGYWYIIKSSNGAMQFTPWGSSALGDIPAPGDYDGDGKTDIGVFRPGQSAWYILRSSNNSILSKLLGQAGDTPLPGAPR